MVGNSSLRAEGKIACQPTVQTPEPKPEMCANGKTDARAVWYIRRSEERPGTFKVDRRDPPVAPRSCGSLVVDKAGVTTISVSAEKKFTRNFPASARRLVG